jgi:hypothetical protein
MVQTLLGGIGAVVGLGIVIGPGLGQRVLQDLAHSIVLLFA